MSATDNAFDSFNPLFVELLDDVAKSEGKSAQSESDRRSYVRAVFALIEGTTFSLKQLAVTGPHGGFSAAEIAALKEESYGLKEDGAVYVRSARLRCLPNVRLALHAVVRAHGAHYRANLGGPGWEALRSAVKIRDRLMHPKLRDDLNVTDDELEAVGRAFRWFVASTALALKSAVTSLGTELLSLIHISEPTRPY